MLMLFMILLGLVQFGRAVLMLTASGVSSEQTNTLIIGVLCLAVAELSRRQSRAEPEPELEVIPNRPHPLERPIKARPSVPALPTDK